MKRLAAQQAGDGEGAAAPGSMPADRFLGVDAAARPEAAVAAEKWREQHAVALNEQQQQAGRPARARAGRDAGVR